MDLNQLRGLMQGAQQLAAAQGAGQGVRGNQQSQNAMFGGAGMGQLQQMMGVVQQMGGSGMQQNAGYQQNAGNMQQNAGYQQNAGNMQQMGGVTVLGGGGQPVMLGGGRGAVVMGGGRGAVVMGGGGMYQMGGQPQQMGGQPQQMGGGMYQMGGQPQQMGGGMMQQQQAPSGPVSLNSCDEAFDHILNNRGDLVQIAAYLEQQSTADQRFFKNHGKRYAECVNHLSEQPLTNEMGVMKFLQIGTKKLANEPKSCGIAIPGLLRFMHSQNSGIKYSAYGPVASVAMQMPKLLAKHANAVLDLVGSTMPELAFTLGQMYKFNPSPFEEHLEVLLSVAEKDQAQSTLVLRVMGDIGKNKPDLLLPHMEYIIESLDNSVNATAGFMVLKELSRFRPAQVYAHFSDIKDSADVASYHQYYYAGVLGNLAALGEAQAQEMTNALMDLLRDPSMDTNIAATVLMEVKGITEKYRHLIVPHRALIESFEGKSTASTEAARQIIDILEERTTRDLVKRVESLEERVAEMNGKIAETCTNFEDVKRYVDQNIGEVKSFMAEVAKKLPTPTKFTADGYIRKTLSLHFHCCHQHAGCMYPEVRTFTCETKEWGKWMKVAFTVVKLGKSVVDAAMCPTAIVKGGADAVRDLYGIYKSNDDADFNKFITEPFLKSADQDKLIDQLTDNRFFESFTYDPQVAGWQCMSCANGESAAAPAPTQQQPVQPPPSSSGMNMSGVAAALPSHEQPAHPVQPAPQQQATAPAPQQGPLFTTRSGYLHKKGPGGGMLSGKKWKHRFFVLENDCLRYYENSSRAVQKGSISLSAVINLKEGPEPGSFKILTKPRDYQLRADVATEAADWMNALRANISALSQAGGLQAQKSSGGGPGLGDVGDKLGITDHLKDAAKGMVNNAFK